MKALENFDEFIDTPIREVKDSGKDYPVGVCAFGIKVYFMHYKSFAEAGGRHKEYCLPEKL